jgi:entericidin B
MNIKTLAHIALVFAALLAISGCANTVAGAGKDAAATVDATQGAAEDLGEAVE